MSSKNSIRHQYNGYAYRNEDEYVNGDGNYDNDDNENDDADDADDDDDLEIRAAKTALTIGSLAIAHYNHDDNDNDDVDDDDDDDDLEIRAAKTALTIGSFASRYSSPPLCQTNILVMFVCLFSQRSQSTSMIIKASHDVLHLLGGLSLQ